MTTDSSTRLPGPGPEMTRAADPRPYGGARQIGTPATAYAVARLHDADPHPHPHPHPEIADYIERITATFEPFGGRFLVHGATPEVKEGAWAGHVVIIGFPGIDEARTWWESPAYREIAPLRSRHIQGDVILVRGVPEDYDPKDTAKAIRGDSASQ